MRLGPSAALVSLVVGGTLTAVGLTMLVAAALALSGDGELVATFALSGVGTAAVGALGLLLARRRRRSSALVSPCVGFLSVTLAWLTAALAGSVPFLVAGVFGSPIDAFFEAMSGFTTTGATRSARRRS